NKAAEEIKDRILASGADSIEKKGLNYFGTFHSAARNLLANVLPVGELGYTKEFTVVDQNGLGELFDSVIRNNKLNIKYKKKLEKRLDDFREGKMHYGNVKYDDEIGKLVSIMKVEKVKRNVMDFDDLIENCTLLLKKSNFKPSWVIIDEFQDTDSFQLEMIDALAGHDTNIFAVGDPNQIIYTWRGSRQDIFETFKERYGAKELTLPISYRSSGTILEAARAFLNNPQSLEGIRDMGNPIVVRRHYNSFNEAIYLVDTIRKLHEQGVPYREVAVFYRKQKQSAVFEDVFRREGIPYEVSVKKTLRDIPVLYWLSRVLKAALNKKDTGSLIYAAEDKKYGPGVSSKKFFKLLEKETGEENKNIPLIVRRIIGFKDWCTSLEDTDKLEDKIYEYFDLDRYLSPTSISFYEDKEFVMKYLEDIKNYLTINGYGCYEGIKNAVDDSVLYGRQVINEIIDPEKECVKLMTLHASKGLEFKYVFISGANYGVIPISGKLDDEEEKRLFFVGITRAKDYLEISYHSNPEDYNTLPDPSPFIRMIPEKLVESDDIKSRAHKLSELRREIKGNMDRRSQEKNEKRKAVFHAKYGNGFILSEDDDMIIVEFEGYGEKSFSKLFCPLKYVEQ
ncbi:MAG TPA: ATP-dependent helicase, partial [Clostridia bacterium]|nr:ATP-dependent helicase [Clostridia bacterium]